MFTNNKLINLEITSTKQWSDMVILLKVLLLNVGTERILVASICVLLNHLDWLLLMLLIDQIYWFNTISFLRRFGLLLLLALCHHWMLFDLKDL